MNSGTAGGGGGGGGARRRMLDRIDEGGDISEVRAGEDAAQEAHLRNEAVDGLRDERRIVGGELGASDGAAAMAGIAGLNHRASGRGRHSGPGRRRWRSRRRKAAVERRITRGPCSGEKGLRVVKSLSAALFPYNRSRRDGETSWDWRLSAALRGSCGRPPLVLPVSLLLFLQWPLRELVQAGSREANDLAQILFALFVAVALTAATRDRAHLAADVLARRYPPIWRERLWRAACLLVVVPASLFVIGSGAREAWSIGRRARAFSRNAESRLLRREDRGPRACRAHAPAGDR